MAFRKYMKVERVEAVLKNESENIRKLVKKAGKRSAADLTDEQRKGL